MNWFIIDLPKQQNSDIMINDKIKNKIDEIGLIIINNLKNLVTPH